MISWLDFDHLSSGIDFNFLEDLVSIHYYKRAGSAGSEEWLEQAEALIQDTPVSEDMQHIVFS